MLVVVVAIVAIAAFFAGPILFPVAEAPGGEPMPGNLLPAYIFLSVWSALTLGVGVALLIWGATSYSKWPQQLRTPLLLVLIAALSLSLPTWVHEHLHQSTFGGTWTGLATIEYLFHVPWLIFAGVLVLAITRLQKIQVRQ